MKNLTYLLLSATLLLLMLPAEAQETITIKELREEWGNEAFDLQTKPAKPGISDFGLAFAAAHRGNVLVDELYRQLTVKGYKNEDAEFILDPRAGYLSLQMVGDGTQTLEMCYWNLPDGRKRVGLLMFDVYDPDPLPFLRFYDYDAQYNELVAVNPMPVDVQLDHSKCSFHLARTGKDIEIYSYISDTVCKYVYEGVDGFSYEGPDELVPELATRYLYCYITVDNATVNLRDAPGGRVAFQLKPDIYMLAVVDPVNGWWRVKEKYIDTMEEETVIGDGPFWISASLLGLSTRNYDGSPVNLLAEPRTGAAVSGVITDEAATVTPVDATEDFVWIKVKCNDASGWIRVSELCDNPVTTCP